MVNVTVEYEFVQPAEREGRLLDPLRLMDLSNIGMLRNAAGRGEF